jgi:DNA processing protein
VSVPELVLRGFALPPRLGDLESPPDELFVRGTIPRGPAVAIVGTRRPTHEAREFARELSYELAAAGVVVLSGGAAGIDTEAHEGALQARGRSVVVAAAGFERPFPPENADLFLRIVEGGGAYVSLVAADVPAENWRFLVRNGVLAALAHATVVIEAPLRSGARNAASHARRLGRPLFVVPGAPWATTGAGCAEELRLGARPLTKVTQLVDWLAAARLHPVILPDPSAAEEPAPSEMLLLSGASASGADAARVLETVRSGAAYPDDICARTGLGPRRVSELILTLLLDGVLVADRSGRLRII